MNLICFRNNSSTSNFFNRWIFILFIICEIYTCPSWRTDPFLNGPLLLKWSQSKTCWIQLVSISSKSFLKAKGKHRSFRFKFDLNSIYISSFLGQQKQLLKFKEDFRFLFIRFFRTFIFYNQPVLMIPIQKFFNYEFSLISSKGN